METTQIIRPELQEYPHEPKGNVKNNADYSANNYVSIQFRVNNDPNFEQLYFEKLINEGWVKLLMLNDILNQTMRGKYFKYRLNGHSLSGVRRGTFRSGGIVMGPKEDDENPEFIMYKAYNGCIFSLQLSDIMEVYVKNPNKDIINANFDYIKKAEFDDNKMVLFNPPKKKTNFPVFLSHPITNDEVVIFYGKDSYAIERFQQTRKYLYAFDTSNWDFKN
jgi:hypothetical protein